VDTFNFNITLSEVERYKDIAGKRGAMILSTLGKLHPQINVILNHDIGKQLLSDDIDRMDDLLTKIYKQKANDMEMAEFRYLKDKRIPDVLKKLKTYLEKIKEIKDTLSK
jgi:hypothetical protein